MKKRSHNETATLTRTIPWKLTTDEAAKTLVAFRGVRSVNALLERLVIEEAERMSSMEAYQEEESNQADL